MPMDYRVKARLALYHRFHKEFQRTTLGFSNEEKLEIVDVLLEILALFKREEPFDQIMIVYEEKLLRKYRHRIRDFHYARIVDYMYRESNKYMDMLFDLELEVGSGEEQFFNDDGYRIFLDDISRYLITEKELLLMADIIVVKDVPHEEEQVINAEHTGRRQTLSVYYINRLYKMNMGAEISLARFIHFLSGKSIDNIGKVLSRPLKDLKDTGPKAKLELIKDLQYIRDFFIEMNAIDVVTLIDEDIKIIQK